jgi:predicted  nucleic acid-binding Zn-ribbon protein
MKMSNPNNDLNIVVDGVEYPIKDLPKDIQDLFDMFHEWSVELQAAKRLVFKNEAAIRAISAEIEARIRQKVKQDAEPDEM